MTNKSVMTFISVNKISVCLSVYENLRKTLFDDNNIVRDLPSFQEATTMTQFKILFNPRG